jgi:asparagine synthase (glutamine-hydrolysing)
VSTLPARLTYNLSERAREIAPVRMTGLYGDEVLRPLRRAFKPVDPAQQPFSPSFLPQIQDARKTYGRQFNAILLRSRLFARRLGITSEFCRSNRLQMAVRTPFLDNDILQIIFRAPESAIADNRLRERLIGDGSQALRRIPTDRGFAGKPGLGGWLLRQYLEFTFKAEYA